MLILLDMDGVLADFDKGFYERWSESYSTLHPPIAKQARTTFYIREDYPQHLHEQIEAIYHRQHFYRNLPVMKGAKEAVQQLLAAGHEIRICTSPLTTNPYCASEKFGWVEEHFGSDFLKRIIIAKDKTWVRGDILIDDKPVISGSLTPTWTHIIYGHPYNRNANGTRLTWDNYETILAQFINTQGK